MAEIIDLLEYKRKREEEEIESLRTQLNEILVFPPEPLPYHVPYEYTYYGSFDCWPSPGYEENTYPRGYRYDDREYLFHELWPQSSGENSDERE